MTEAAKDEPVRGVRLPPGDFLRLGFLGIRIRVMRAALSALGISIGIATMIVVPGIPASSRRHLLDELESLGPDILQAQAVGQQDEQPSLPKEAAAMAGRIGPVTSATAVANTNARVLRSDRAPADDGVGMALNVLCCDVDGTEINPPIVVRRSTPDLQSARATGRRFDPPTVVLVRFCRSEAVAPSASAFSFA